MHKTMMLAAVAAMAICGGCRVVEVENRGDGFLTDKDGQPENVELRIRAGEVISLVGPTGSGKSQLLADIECAAVGHAVLFQRAGKRPVPSGAVDQQIVVE